MHSGHRERMRKRIKENGIESLSDHEILEFLLYHVQARVDTNAAAHRLLDRFGSLDRVLDAEPADLMQVEGIGEKSALFLHSIPGLCRRYHLKKQSDRVRFEDMNSLIEYTRVFFTGVTGENAALFLMDESLALISSRFIAGGSSKEVYVNRQTVLKEALNAGAGKLVLVHSHPSCDPNPSPEDITVTKNLASVLEGAGIELIDHIIICPDGSCYSFAVGGIVK